MRSLVIVLLILSTAVYGSDSMIVVVHPMPTLVDVNGNHLDGILVRRIREAAKIADIPVSFRVRPWKRAYRDAIKGRCHAIAPILKNAEREKLLTYSHPHLHTPRYVLAVREGFTELTETPEDLRTLAKLRVDYVRGYSLMERLDKMKGIAIPADGDCTDVENGIDKLLRKRFDILISDEDTLRGAMAKKGVTHQIMILAPAVQQKPSYIAFHRSPETNEWARRLSDAMSQMHQSGRFAEIRREYFQSLQVAER